MIKVRSKTLFIPAEEQSIGAVGEADSTVREFHIDRVSGDGVDLANLLFKLNIRYAGVRDIDRSDLEKVVTDNAIILRWLISSVTLRNAGTAFLQLDAFDETGSCRWKSYPGAVYIEKSLGNTEVSSNTLSELEQLEKKFAKVGEGESARVEAEKKRVSAEEKREEAEGKRNTSLANIIAEEEKIKAVSAEAKGYKDSVLADKQEITTMKNEAVSAKTEALQHANAAEASKNSTITEGTKIKEAVTALKNEANTAKADAVNAKNEAVSAKNGANTIKGEVLALKNEANTIKGEVQALKNETESRLQSAESNIQNQVMNATSYANMAERSSQQAEGYKMEAGVSAEKAKESETKTLEALKKAQEGGKVAGVTADEMHSYVDTAVGKIKSGITEAEAVTIVGSELKKKEMPQTNYKELAKETVSGGPGGLNSFGKTTLVDGETLSNVINGIAEGTKERFLDKSGLNGAVTPIVENTLKEKSKVDGNIGTIFEHLLENPNKREAWYAGNKIVSGEVLDLAIRKISYNIRDYIEEAASSERPISSRFRMDAPSLEVLERVKNEVEYGGYDVIKPGDYIDLGTTIPGTPSMRFYVMGVDTFGTKPCIDFVSFDYPDKFQMKEGLDHYKPSPIMINASVFGKVFNDKRLVELHEARNKEYISNKTISIFWDDTKQKIDIAFWTLDLSHILGSPILLLAGGSVETTGILPYPLFQKEKFVKALGKGSLITSTTTANNINIVDLEGYIGSMTKEEAFLEIPEGPNKEAELKKRPIIPICFRIAKTGN
nr:MAG TPA: tail fiber protein [Caudoviricetes sp.]